MRRKLFKNNKKLKAASLIEVLLSSAILSLFTTALFSGLYIALENIRTNGNQSQAVSLVDEGLEAIRNMRDEDFANLTNGTYGLAVSGNQWVFSGTEDVWGNFTRQITISDVDAETKKAIVEVTWSKNPQLTGSVSFMTYLTNWHEYIPVYSVGDWSNPSIESTIDLSGGENGLRVQVSGDYAYIIRKKSNPNFAIVDLTDTSSPSIVGSLEVRVDLSNLSVSGDFAYLGTENDSKEVVVIDISNKTTPFETGNYNATGNKNVRGIFISGSYAFITRQKDAGTDEFEIIDISNPSSPTYTASMDIGEEAYDIYVNGNYAYVGARNHKELNIFDISNPSSPVLTGTYDITLGDEQALAVNGFDNYIVMGTNNGDMFIFDVSDPYNPGLIGSYDAIGKINDLSIDPDSDLVFLATDTGGKEFQVVDISNKAVPVLLGSIDAPSHVKGMAYDFAKDRAYAMLDKDDQEFTIYQPGEW